MKLSVLLFGTIASAYPQGGLNDPLTGLLNLTNSIFDNLESLGAAAVNAIASGQPNQTFDGNRQLIDVNGIHEWQAPGPDDIRGPCPGLNALANHGYLPRNGFGTVVDFIAATTEVFGMGLDLATVLSAYGAVIDGVGAGWNIGGQIHTGIGGSRGNYENDASPMRGDLYQYGSNTDLVMTQFEQLFDLQPDAATANYNIDVLGKFKAKRFQDSVANNPYFYFGPFSGPAVSTAAFSFIYRFMANHTEANPEGVLDQDILKSFFAISGDRDNFKWTPGNERIPEAWYRRPIGDTYGLFSLGDDAGVFAKDEPRSSTAGCNQGKGNSYTTITPYNTSASNFDFSSPTGGVCYAIALAGQYGVNSVPAANSVIRNLLLPFQGALKCPTIANSNATLFETCPGYSFYAGPTAKIVSGAVPN